MTKIGAIIEARMSSSRLPGKILKEWHSKPMLEIMIERLKDCKNLDKIIVATTTNPKDDLLCDFLRKKEIGFFRGSESNVLERVLYASQLNKIDVIVELTGDCNLIDWTIVDQSIEHFFNTGADYVGNCCIASYYPRGQDVKVFTTDTLRKVNELWGGDLDAQEHVSLPIYRHPELFKLSPLPAPNFYIETSTRLTLDYKEDYIVICKILDELGEKCSLGDICHFLDDHPDVRDINGKLNVSYINDSDRNKK